MALRDYILCSKCKCKLIYDGSDAIRDQFDNTYGPEWNMFCPKCIAENTRAEPIEALLKQARDKLQAVLLTANTQDMVQHMVYRGIGETIRAIDAVLKEE